MTMLLCARPVRAGNIIGGGVAARLGDGYPDSCLRLPNFRQIGRPEGERAASVPCGCVPLALLWRRGWSERHAHAQSIGPSERVKEDRVRATHLSRRERRVLVAPVAHGGG